MSVRRHDKVWAVGVCFNNDMYVPDLVLNVIVSEEEVGVTNESLGTPFYVASVGKRVTDSPKGNTSTAGIQEIPKNDVLDILSSDATSTQHGKTSLHEVHQSTCKDEIERVNSTSNTAGFFINELYDERGNDGRLVREQHRQFQRHVTRFAAKKLTIWLLSETHSNS